MENGDKSESYTLTLEQPFGNIVFQGIPAFDEAFVYYSAPEGTYFQIDEQGNRTGKTGLSAACLNYEVYVNEATEYVNLPEKNGVTNFNKGYFFIPNNNYYINAFINETPALDNPGSTVLAFLMKWNKQLKDGIRLNNERTTLRLSFQSKKEQHSTDVHITFVKVKTDVSVVAAALTNLELQNLVSPDDAGRIQKLYVAFEALTDDEKARISQENREKLKAAMRMLGVTGSLWEGKGTAEEPYLLKSGEDLKNLSDSVNDKGKSYSSTYFRFENDITLPNEWTPIGTKNNRFSGNIDGNGKKLTVPAGTLSLIGTPSGASVKNLKLYGEKIPGYGLVQNYVTESTMDIDNVTILTGSRILYSGFVGGYGNTPVNIRNCTVQKGVIIGDDGSGFWGDLGDTAYNYAFVGTFNHQDNIGSFGGAWNGTIVNCVSYATVYEGESVYDVLKRVCRENRIHMEASWTPMYNSAYVEGIGNLYEFDGGSGSGWMYRVDGWYPNYGCSRYQLKQGEAVEWRYTCDLGKDIGGASAVGG